MVHLIFDRPNELVVAWKIGVRGMIAHYAASGDAWGDGVSGPYGHDYPIAPGHYKLGVPQSIAPPIISEGAWQIPVIDLSDADIERMESSGYAVRSGETLNIGGTRLPIFGLGRYGREAIFIHGGGSNLGDPEAFAVNQPLCKTEGCTRMHNGDLDVFAKWITEEITGNLIIFSCIGDPKALAQ